MSTRFITNLADFAEEWIRPLNHESICSYMSRYRLDIEVVTIPAAVYDYLSNRLGSGPLAIICYLGWRYYDAYANGRSLGLGEWLDLWLVDRHPVNPLYDCYPNVAGEDLCMVIDTLKGKNIAHNTFTVNELIECFRLFEQYNSFPRL